MQQSYDLIIIGGGLVGAGLAVALRESGLQIALVDARLPHPNDPRLLALNYGSCQFLQRIGLWSRLTEYATPIHQVHVSKQRHFGAVRLRKEEVRLPSLGHIIPARYIEAALQETLLSLPHFTLYQPATLQTLQQQDEQVQLTINTDTGAKYLVAPLVIGADGAESTVRTQLNVTTEVIDYAQSALVTKTRLQRSHHHIAYERFTNNGAIAMLPLQDDECATIWTADNATITQLEKLPASEFLQALQKEFGYRLGRLQDIGQRHVFPLRMLRAQNTAAKNVFLLGNSAHTLHPIAAQGFNLALYEVMTLVDSVLEKCKRQEPFTSADFAKVSTHIQKQQAASIGLSHRLPSLFTSQSSIISIALQLGMMCLDTLPPLKKRFMTRFVGSMKEQRP